MINGNMQNKIKRSEFFKYSLLAFAGGLAGPKASVQGLTNRDGATNQPTPLIHATDLYRPHCDPDDHWDLATVYALAYLGAFELEGILHDYPSRPNLGDPDIMGVGQMNYCTGLAVPSVFGYPDPMKSRGDTQLYPDELERQGINWLINTLRKSVSPVIINIVGAATNVAVALKKEPALFKEKCKAIYLNAGSANSVKDRKLEYNVKLNPLAYVAIFDAPCPVYWLPCTTKTNIGEVGEYGSYYRFNQGDILKDLPSMLQNFFLSMLRKEEGAGWLKYLKNDPAQELIEKFSNVTRHMWCTAGFIHAAGKKVTPDGEVVQLNSGENAVCSFTPIKVSCNDQGYANWKVDYSSRERYILHVEDLENYQVAMTKAMKGLLLKLPG